MASVFQKIGNFLNKDEVRTVVSYAGQQYTEMEPVLGEHYGQILVSLQPETGDLRDVQALIETMRTEVTAVAGPMNISFLIPLLLIYFLVSLSCIFGLLPVYKPNHAAPAPTITDINPAC